MAAPTKADVLLGLQWGDEGKGKIVDVLSQDYQVVARFQGGPNAGHTLEFNQRKFVLHTIPSGIFRPECMNLVGNGVVLDPGIFSRELDQTGLPFEQLAARLIISNRCHLILPSHRLVDAANEQFRGQTKIGSTLKGIGPAYTDKVARCGLRVGDAQRKEFASLYADLKRAHLGRIANLGVDPDSFLLDGKTFDDYEKEWFAGLERLLSLRIEDAEIYINKALDKGLKVLAEGAQGTLLDVEFGSYPYVTSSNTVTAGACTGLGLAPSRLGEVYGVFKAYCTRVGSGPFPTELFDHAGENLRKKGHEFGSTTGRPRRCGWLDMPALKYAVMINGVTRLVMTKADVLSDMEQIRICNSYLTPEGHVIDYPQAWFGTDAPQPLYEDMDAWGGDVSRYSSFDELPPALQKYTRQVEDQTGAGVSMISTGPDRTQIIFR